jgi:DedD protein
MAKATSDEELQLKKRARRRLVGAIALVLIVVVFLPMFLDNEPKPLNQDIAITIPPIPDPDASPLPATPDAAPDPEPVAEDERPPASVETVRVEPKLSTPAPKPVVSAPKPVVSAPKPAVAEGFVVQLGAFSNAANAATLKNKLLENKFKAYTEVISSPAGTRTRVRVGPYSSRQDAENARETLRSRKLVIGDATVVRLGD